MQKTKKQCFSSFFSSDNTRRSGKEQKKGSIRKKEVFDQFKDISFTLTKRLIPWTICVLLRIALIHSFFYPLPFSPFPKTDLPHSTTNNITYCSSLSASPPSSAGISMFKSFFLILGLVIFFVPIKLPILCFLF